jgi:phosphate transport system substrate-binding protein
MSIRLFSRLALGVLAGAVLLAGGCGGNRVKLQGVGATFPEPIYKRWFSDYGKQNPGVVVNYQGQGSGAGVKQFTQGLVDFGASDAPMTDAEIKAVDGKVVQLPMTAGSVVLAYNLRGVKDLQLSRKALAGICLGKIKKWNDDEIRKHNPNARLPDRAISFVHRADSSGTTFVFTNYLSAISDEWKNDKSRGARKDVTWPSGNFSAANKNAGVAQQVQQNEGSVGYIEYGYATKTEDKLPMAVLENKAGKFVKPTPESGAAALAGAKLPEDMRLIITDPAGAGAYPIVSYTWILARPEYDDRKGPAFKGLLKYCLTEGQKVADELGYIPLPEEVAKEVIQKVETIKP